jgi:hypothetical protein
MGSSRGLMALTQGEKNVRAHQHIKTPQHFEATLNNGLVIFTEIWFKAMPFWDAAAASVFVVQTKSR